MGQFVMFLVGMTAVMQDASARAPRKQEVVSVVHAAITYATKPSIVPGQSVIFDFHQTCYIDKSEMLVDVVPCAQPEFDGEAAWLAPFIVSFEQLKNGDFGGRVEIPAALLAQHFDLTRSLPESIDIVVGPLVRYETFDPVPKVGVEVTESRMPTGYPAHEYVRLLRRQKDGEQLSPAEQQRLEELDPSKRPSGVTHVEQLWPFERSDTEQFSLWRGVTAEGAMSNLPPGSRVCFDPGVMTSPELGGEVVPSPPGLQLNPSSRCQLASGTVTFSLSPNAPLGIGFAEVVFAVPKLAATTRRLKPRVPRPTSVDRDVQKHMRQLEAEREAKFLADRAAFLAGPSFNRQQELERVMDHLEQRRNSRVVTITQEQLKELFGS